MRMRNSKALRLILIVWLAWTLPAGAQTAGKDEVQPWIKMANTGTADNLYAIAAVSKKSVWFAGANGTILKWDGRMFRSFKVELPDGVLLCDIHMFSDSDGWAVGYNMANNYGRIYRWDGRSWKLATSEGVKGFKCRAIAFLSPQDGLIAGEEGRLWRWDGMRWVDQTTDIYESGGKIDASRVGGVTDLLAIPDQRVYVMACTYKTNSQTEAVFIRLNLDVYPFGAYFNAPTRDRALTTESGRLFHVPGGMCYYLIYSLLCTFDPNVSGYLKAGSRQFNFNLHDGSLRGLWVFGKDNGWFAGYPEGSVIHLKPGPSTKTYQIGSEFLTDIWMHDENFGFIAGAKGTVLMRNTTAAVDIDVDADRLVCDYGAPVLVQAYRPSAATPVAVPLAGAQWEIKRETTVNEQTAVSTVSTRPLGTDRPTLDPNVPLTWTWDQKDGRGRQVDPGIYRIVFHAGDRAPFARITIRPPAGSAKAGDAPVPSGGLSLEVRDSYPPADITFKLVNRGKKSVSITGESYSVALKREAGWQVFYESGLQSAFRPATIGAGKEYAWVWKRQDTTGRHTAAPGRYRLSVKLRGQTPELLIKEFDILFQ